MRSVLYIPWHGHPRKGKWSSNFVCVALIIRLEEFYGDISLHGEWEGERNGEGEGAIKCYFTF